MQEMVIYGVSFDLVGKQPIVLLKTADGNKFLPIWIGHPEAAAILMKLQGASTPRPMTHDLVTDMLEQLDAQVTRITVTELKENTFYASITVAQNGSEIEIDSRPSDAIALAVRAEAPIFANERVIEESAIEFEGEEVNEEEIVDEFRKFLDDVSPDQFARGGGGGGSPSNGDGNDRGSRGRGGGGGSAGGRCPCARGATRARSRRARGSAAPRSARARGRRPARLR